MINENDKCKRNHKLVYTERETMARNSEILLQKKI